MKLDTLAADLYARSLLMEAGQFDDTGFAYVTRDEDDEFKVKYLSTSHATLDLEFERWQIGFVLGVTSAEEVKMRLLRFLEQLESTIVQKKHRIRITIIRSPGRKDPGVAFVLEKEDLCHA